MDNKLLQARIKAFFVQFGSMIAVALIGIISSPEFKALVTEHFGTGFAVGAGLLFITGLASHLANKMALKKLGARREDSDVILI